MRLRDAAEIGLYLAGATGGEVLAMKLSTPGKSNLFLDSLPYVVFFAGLYLAYRVARRAHRQEFPTGEGFLCTKCGYDMRGTPERCPECGGEGTGKHIIPGSKRSALAIAIMEGFVMVMVAVLAAAAIMIHVQIFNAPPSGH